MFHMTMLHEKCRIASWFSTLFFGEYPGEATHPTVRLPPGS
ncbi:MAG: hypothetical protein ACRDB3_02650 [Citrobacter telavivensis]